MHEEPLGHPVVRQSVGVAQGPWKAMLWLAASAWQAFEYVCPSQPQTGSKRSMHTSGTGVHAPPPEAPHVSAGYSQNERAPQAGEHGVAGGSQTIIPQRQGSSELS